jgi:hypothetical protein
VATFTQLWTALNTVGWNLYTCVDTINRPSRSKKYSALLQSFKVHIKTAVSINIFHMRSLHLHHWLQYHLVSSLHVENVDALLNLLGKHYSATRRDPPLNKGPTAPFQNPYEKREMLQKLAGKV